MIKLTIYIFTLTVLAGCNSLKADETAKPNIIFILIDDLGYTDLGCYGSSFYETPNIDRLAREGVRFTNSYAASGVCSPTRASILTGKYPARLHLTDWTGPEQWHVKGKLNTPKFQQFLPLEEKTIGEAFKENGYRTAYIGKWHLGGPEFYPDHQGFDWVVAANNAGAPPSYFYPYINKSWEGLSWPSELTELQKEGEKGEYLTDRLTKEAIQFIQAEIENPFFLFLAHYAVHTPLQAKEEYIEKYCQIAAQLNVDSADVWETEIHNSYVRQVQNHPVYAGMVKSVDESVGQIREYLKKQGLAENTIIVFTSDNGGLSIRMEEQYVPERIATSVKPLRAGKGWNFEGGIRIPTIVYLPGQSSPEIIHEPVISTDFYPTLLELAGLKTIPEQHVDGISLLPLLRNENTKLERDALYWHYPHYHGSGERPSSAVRKRNYKLIYHYEDDISLLFDLSKDIAEKHDLANELPEVRDELKNDLKHWLKEVDAQMPK